MVDKKGDNFRKKTLENYSLLQNQFKEAYDIAKDKNNVANIKKLVTYKESLSKIISLYNKKKTRIKDLSNVVNRGLRMVDSITHPTLILKKSPAISGGRQVY